MITERRVSPRCIRAKAAAVSSRPIVSLTSSSSLSDTLPVAIHQKREIARWHAITVAAAAQCAAHFKEGDRGSCSRASSCRHAEEHTGAATVQAAKRLEQRFRPSYRLEGIIHAEPARQLAHARHGILSRAFTV